MQRRKSSRKRSSKVFGKLLKIDIEAFLDRVRQARQDLGIPNDAIRYVPLREEAVE